MLDSLYHRTLKLLCNNAKTLPYTILLRLSLHNVTKICLQILNNGIISLPDAMSYDKLG